jgi:hypothetical protein
MSAVLHDLAFLKNQNSVGILNRRKPMSDGDSADRADSVLEVIDGLLDFSLVLLVKCASSFVED